MQLSLATPDKLRYPLVALAAGSDLYWIKIKLYTLHIMRGSDQHLLRGTVSQSAHFSSNMKVPNKSTWRMDPCERDCYRRRGSRPRPGIVIFNDSLIPRKSADKHLVSDVNIDQLTAS